MTSTGLWPVVFVFSVTAMAAAPGSSSGIEGTVTLGETAFAGVEVAASSSSLGQFWETSTDGSGRYLMDQLPPGRYTLWAEATGRGCIVIRGVVVKNLVRTRRNFHFAKGHTYPRCESLRPKKGKGS